MKKIFAIYNANSGIIGEFSYVMKKLAGKTHCALCDITHGYNPLGKPEWKQCVQNFSIPIETLHINEMNEEIKEFVKGNTPIVILQDNNYLKLLLDKSDLESCHKNPSKLIEMIQQKLLALSE